MCRVCVLSDGWTIFSSDYSFSSCYTLLVNLQKARKLNWIDLPTCELFNLIYLQTKHVTHCVNENTASKNSYLIVKIQVSKYDYTISYNSMLLKKYSIHWWTIINRNNRIFVKENCSFRVLFHPIATSVGPSQLKWTLRLFSIPRFIHYPCHFL